jgi:hypothetical protein
MFGSGKCFLNYFFAAIITPYMQGVYADLMPTENREPLLLRLEAPD